MELDTYLLGLIMMLGGIFLLLSSKNGPNSNVGYRSIQSQKNAQTWEFANTFSGILLLISGFFYTIVFYYIVINSNYTYLKEGLFTLMSIIIIIIVITELFLYKRFNKKS